MSVPSVRDVLNHHVHEGFESDIDHLEEALLAREDGLADLLRLAGVQFGMHAEVVAKVLMDVGLGTPPTKEQRHHINQRFAVRMEMLSTQWRRDGR